MSLTEKYRSSTDYREILRILQKASSLQDNFLWQTHALGKSIIPIHHFEIDFVTREVVVYFDDSRFGVEKDLTLYVKLDYRTSVFKVTEFRKGKNSVHFTFPKEVKTLQLRSTPRHQFPPGSEHRVSLRPSQGGREQGHELHVRVMDVSPQGLGIIVSEQNRNFLKNNRILWVTQLGTHTLLYPVLAEIAYISTDLDPKFLNRKQKELKVGLKLSGVIPEDVYNNFLQ